MDIFLNLSCCSQREVNRLNCLDLWIKIILHFASVFYRIRYDIVEFCKINTIISP